MNMVSRTQGTHARVWWHARLYMVSCTQGTHARIWCHAHIRAYMLAAHLATASGRPTKEVVEGLKGLVVAGRKGWWTKGLVVERADGRPPGLQVLVVEWQPWLMWKGIGGAGGRPVVGGGGGCGSACGRPVGGGGGRPGRAGCQPDLTAYALNPLSVGSYTLTEVRGQGVEREMERERERGEL